MAVIAIEPEVKAPFFFKLTSLMSQYNTKGPINFALFIMLKLLINVIRAIGCTSLCVCLCIDGKQLE